MSAAEAPAAPCGCLDPADPVELGAAILGALADLSTEVAGLATRVAAVETTTAGLADAAGQLAALGQQLAPMVDQLAGGGIGGLVGGLFRRG